ncbi:MAG: hypothetical protein AAB511_00985 [Patescibacteria group bacterium]
MSTQTAAKTASQTKNQTKAALLEQIARLTADLGTAQKTVTDTNTRVRELEASNREQYAENRRLTDDLKLQTKKFEDQAKRHAACHERTAIQLAAGRAEQEGAANAFSRSLEVVIANLGKKASSPKSSLFGEMPAGLALLMSMAESGPSAEDAFADLRRHLETAGGGH